MLPDKQNFINVPFQLTKYGKKELCDKVREIIGDVYCPTCSKCGTTNKTTSFYDCENPAATFWILLLRTRNRQLCCLVVSLLTRVATTKDHLHFLSPPITTKHIRNWTKKGQIKSKYGINVSVFLLADDLSNIFIFQIILFNFNLQLTAQI